MALTDKTRPELVARTLGVLGIVGAGQSPAAEDVQLVDDQVEPTIERLNSEGITYIGDFDAIPADQFQYVAILLADAVKSDFGLAALPMDDPLKAESRLRVINAGHASGAVLAVDYF